MLAGENLVWLWRDHRGTTGQELATEAQINTSYLSEIEKGHKLV
jgi:hypothetical protein